MDNKLAILVLSCDKYGDLWEDFFNLKEKFWPDCPYPCYLATDSIEYNREGVKLIHFGNIKLWSICAQRAIEQIEEPYIALFLEDAFIYKTIDTNIIEEDLKFVIDNDVDFMTLERDRRDTCKPADEVKPHIWKINQHRRYGIDTSAAIWKKEYLLELLKAEDCNPWQFEVNQCIQAKTEEGLQGRIFFDDRIPFNISPVGIVILGKLMPGAIKFYKKLGYDIDTTKRKQASGLEAIWCSILGKASKYPAVREPLKKIAKVLGMKFFSP